MPRSFFFLAPRQRHLILPATVLLLLSAAAQQPPAQQSANPNPGTKLADGKTTTEKSKPTPDDSAARQTLAQFNDALENLAAKVSPAVVQILVTGYGPLHEENRTQTALIVRQHAVGSGVIVDPN